MIKFCYLILSIIFIINKMKLLKASNLFVSFIMIIIFACFLALLSKTSLGRQVLPNKWCTITLFAHYLLYLICFVIIMSSYYGISLLMQI